MTRKLMVLFASLTVLALLVGACVAPVPAAQPAAADASAAPAAEAAPAVTFAMKDPVKVGYSVYDMQQPYWQAYAKGIEDASVAAGYEFLLSDQKSSQQAQVSGSIDLINQGISALVVSPVQPAALPASIDAAHEAQIPVIIGDVGAEGNYDAFILSDNYAGGQVAAQYMVDTLGSVEGQKEVLMILLHPGSAVGEVRAAGFRDEMAKHEDFTIVAELNGNDTVEGGYNVTRDTLSANPNLVGIYATNDPEALGAAQALETVGKSGVGDVLLVGFNGDPPALELIQQGKMAATIRQDPYGQGQRAVEVATALMKNESITYSDDATRSIYFPVTLVNADNVAEFMQ